MQFFYNGYFEDLLALTTFAKNFGFLAEVFKIFAIENALQSKNQSPYHNIRAQKLDSQNGIHVLCKFIVFAKKYILQIFFQRPQNLCLFFVFRANRHLISLA